MNTPQTLLAIMLALALLAPATAAVAAPEAPAATAEDQAPAADQAPDPALSPADVVRIQMRALQRNDAEDSGIRTTYRFAAPSNREATGPFERFALMIKAAYSPMLNAARLEFGAMSAGETRAMQEVTVVDADGGEVTYVFILGLQREAPYQDCWMTEAVLTKPGPQSPPRDGGPPGLV